MPHYLRLDPTLPVTWESCDTLRIGYERVVTRIENPSQVVEKFLQNLRRGASFDPEAPGRSGIAPSEWSELIRTLAPALITADSPGANFAPLKAVPPLAARSVAKSLASRPTLVVVGESLLTRSLIPVLEQVGCHVLDSRDPQRLSQQNATLVTVHSFLEPDRYDFSELTPVLPTIHICLTDQSVWIGPLVVPNASPCARCATLHDLDVDPQKSVVAAQLLHRVVATASHHVFWRIASILLTALVRDSARTELATSRLQLSLAQEHSGLVVKSHRLRSHPRCSRCCAATAGSGAGAELDHAKIESERYLGVVSPASAIKREGIR